MNYLKQSYKIFLIFLISIFFIEKSFSITPDMFVQSTVNRASEALNSNYTKEEKIEKLKAIAKSTVDLQGLAFYTLGKHKKIIT